MIEAPRDPGPAPDVAGLDVAGLDVAGLDVAGIGSDDIRLMTKVARLYHEQGVRQPEIAERLNISQPRVSRLLKKAVAVGIVRTSVLTPRGVYAQLEEEIERRYGVREVVVADTGGQADELTDEQALTPALGSVAASYLETTLIGGERIGISSWSSVLLATVDSMRPRTGRGALEVVQVLGGAGVVVAQAHATRLTGRLAQLTGATAVYLPAPGLVANRDTGAALTRDATIVSTLERFPALTVLLAGIGSLTPSPLLRASGNSIGADDEQALRSAGAVGDVCMRFFDAQGHPVTTDLDDRVVGIDAETLRRIPRRIGVAGGTRKRDAVRAALLGGWVNTLVTDHATAQFLQEHAP
jgi:DNA-binding transcriptional regulator LsrR (DeoR family)